MRTWSDAQNAHARAYLDGLPATPELRQRIADIVAAISQSYKGFQLRGSTLFALTFKPPKQQQFLVAFATPDGPAGLRVLVDPNVLDPTGATTID